MDKDLPDTNRLILFILNKTLFLIQSDRIQLMAERYQFHLRVKQSNEV